MSKKISVISIIFVVWTVWLAYLGLGGAIEYLVSNWEIVLTMSFGSVVAGATSIGGGAVAFPVFTKVLHIPPYEAKVFSLAIQSVGMGAASLTIYLTGIKVEWRVIRWGSLGGVVGIYLGLNFLAPLLPPDVIKMSFTVMLASFAITLFALNRGVNKRHSSLFVWTFHEKSILFMAGLAGGLMSALAGTGIDIVVFSVMVLLFRISEKIATPTSVILMAINAAVGFLMQVFILQDFAEPVHSYWLATIPVVIVGAPLGAILCSMFRRETIVNILIFLILIEMLSSLLIISLRPLVVYSSLITLILSCFFYYWMYRTRIYQKLEAT
ncbi:MAG: sulfite exporter TauE/SafE family protein [Pseudomonadota bacterium]